MKCCEVSLRIIRGFLRVIDTLSYWTGGVIRWLGVAIIVTIFYEVVARYVFNAPTFWSYDMAYFLGASYMMLAGCYVTLVKGHVRIDALFARFPRKLQLWIDTVLTVVMFFPLWIMVTPRAWKAFIKAWTIGETSSITRWYAPLWPVRLIIALGLTLLLLAGISWFIKTIYELRTGKELRSGMEESR